MKLGSMDEARAARDDRVSALLARKARDLAPASPSIRRRRLGFVDPTQAIHKFLEIFDRRGMINDVAAVATDCH